jgi:hypothetical protein
LNFELISDDVREDCIEGLCYCKEGGMLVSPKIEIDRVTTTFKLFSKQNKFK